MVRISVEVKSGPARFRVGVQAQSIERALEMIQRQYLGKDCKVRFPIDSEAFFARESRGEVEARIEALGMVVA